LMIVTKEGMIMRQPVEKISVIGRNTQGVKLIGLNEGDKVYDITRIAAEEVEEDDEPEENFAVEENSEKSIEEETVSEKVSIDESAGNESEEN